MIKFINDALKHRNGEKGFSLVELIVVVAILGILVVIAIPVFGAIQQTARENTVKTAAANAATSVAAAIAAADTTNTVTNVITKLNGQGDDVEYTVAANAAKTTPGVVPTGYTGKVATALDNPGFTTGTVYNTTVDNVYIYAVDKQGNWASAGSAGGAVNNNFK
jgi:type IV pilus assembly protein PilA